MSGTITAIVSYSSTFVASNLRHVLRRGGLGRFAIWNTLGGVVGFIIGIGSDGRCNSGRNDVTEATFFIHETGDDIFESERSEGSAGDVDDNRLISRGKAIQKNTNLVEMGNNRRSGGRNRR